MMKFVLFTTTRSGSTWLVDTLNNHPDITMFGEMFRPQKRKWFVGSEVFPEYVEFSCNRPRPFSIWKYLNELYAAPVNSQAVGFKFMYAYLKLYPETISYLAQHKIACIHLVRENLLDVAISLERMRRTGTTHQSMDGENVVWHRVKPINPPETGIYLDPIRLRKFIKKRER